MKIVSPESMVAAIRDVGIIPFFKGPVPGFSVEEMTPPEHWFDSSEELGPWDWKIDAVQSGDIAYGKFLCGGKAAFATVEWYAHLRNWRLSQARFNPDVAGRKVLELMEKQGSVGSKDIRQLLGLKKAAADGVVTKLANGTRLLIGDIQRVYRGPTLKYSGWQTCTFCTPEALFGSDVIGSGDSGTAGSVFGGPGAPRTAAPFFGGFSPFSAEDPLDTGCTPSQSFDALLGHLRELLPEAREKDIRKLLE